MAWAARTIIPESCAHLDFASIEAELARTRGNVSGAAKKLGVPTRDLRKLVWSSELADTVFEAVETVVDDAQEVVLAALRSGEMAHRLTAAKALLRTSAARRRGWGSGVLGCDEAADSSPVSVKLRWLDS
jgi:hypothetical protein